MPILQNTLNSIVPAAAPADDMHQRLAAVMEGDEKALGRLSDILYRYIRLTGELHPDLPTPCTIICCADHGVADEGVSAYPQDTTLDMTRNYLIAQGAAANALAKYCDSELIVADLGIAVPAEEAASIPGLLDFRIAQGTQNMAQGPAMTREQARQSIEAGITLAERAIEQGYDCLLPGEMGIANTTAMACITATFCGLTAEEATGRGTNISDERLRQKQGIVKRALELNQPDADDALDVLAKVGGFELGAIAGIILGAAAHGCCTIIDGANSAAAALIAQGLSPHSIDYVMASHLGSEPAHQHALRHLGLTPCLHLDLRLGEACGSSVLLCILQSILAAWEVLDHLPQSPVEQPFEHVYMSRQAVPATDKTFDFYLNTMQELDGEALAACQDRLNHLAKPIYSLGYLETLATELAAATGDECPPNGSGRSLLCFSGMLPNPMLGAMTEAFAAHAGSVTDEGELSDLDVTIAHLREGLPITSYFNFGREHGEQAAFVYPLLGIAMTELDPDMPLGTAAQRLRESLLDDDGSLRYPADEFLKYAPDEYQGAIAAIMGAIIAAAHNSSLVIVGDAATDIIARYTEAICPTLRHYVLHPQPALLDLESDLPGGTLACLAIQIVDASLAILNDMKTFASAHVAIAIDGPGADGQQ